MATTQTIDAIAEHGLGAIGGRGPIQPTTRITLRRSYREGGEFIATFAGHLEDGALVEILDHGCAYRLHLIGAVQHKAAA
jgi:hypothetical protein